MSARVTRRLSPSGVLTARSAPVALDRKRGPVYPHRLEATQSRILLLILRKPAAVPAAPSAGCPARGLGPPGARSLLAAAPISQGRPLCCMFQAAPEAQVKTHPGQNPGRCGGVSREPDQPLQAPEAPSEALSPARPLPKTRTPSRMAQTRLRIKN